MVEDRNAEHVTLRVISSGIIGAQNATARGEHDRGFRRALWIHR